MSSQSGSGPGLGSSLARWAASAADAADSRDSSERSGQEQTPGVYGTRPVRPVDTTEASGGPGAREREEVNAKTGAYRSNRVMAVGVTLVAGAPVILGGIVGTVLRIGVMPSLSMPLVMSVTFVVAVVGTVVYLLSGKDEHGRRWNRAAGAAFAAVVGVVCLIALGLYVWSVFNGAW